MPVIALTSSKGGCGKSTTALMLASAFSSDGYRVAIVDADRSKRLVKWADHGRKPDNVTVTAATHETLRATIKSCQAENDVVIIDVEGSANMSLALAFGSADAVIIPANQSAPDVEDAVATIALIRDTEAIANRKIPHGLLWTRVTQAIRSREVKALEEQIEEAGVPVLGKVSERTAYKSMFSYSATLAGLPSKEVPGLDKAEKEAALLALSVAQLIETGREVAA